MNVFEVFLPQLLLYPNPSDPLNGEAAALMLREPDTYKAKIKGAFLSSQGACRRCHGLHDLMQEQRRCG